VSLLARPRSRAEALPHASATSWRRCGRAPTLQVVAVTSPGVGDGKNHDCHQTSRGRSRNPRPQVLLVELDLRCRPALARQLGLGRARRSLVDALVNPGLTLEETVEHLPPFQPLGACRRARPPPRPTNCSDHRGCEALLEEARRRYDYIVVDTPPFVPVPDCRLIGEVRSTDFLVVVAHIEHHRACWRRRWA